MLDEKSKQTLKPPSNRKIKWISYIVAYNLD